jgi:uncharacterized small protein (DUF1192 family)
MAWSSGSFTRVRGSASWTNDYNNNTGIEPGLHDTNDQDLAVGINNCIAKDGQNSATGNLDLGGNRLTNVGNAVNAQDTVTLAQAQAGINTQSTTLAISNTKFSADVPGVDFLLRKSRGATVGTNAIVQDGDNLGGVYFQGANGTGYTSAAAVSANVDGTPGASNDMPGRLRFLTTPDGSGTLTERMRIASSGNVGIGNTSPSTLLEVGDGTGNRIITCTGGNSGSSGGSAIYCKNGTTTVSGFGGWSAIVGGTYDATTTMWGAGALRFVSGGGGNERGSINSSGHWALLGSKDRTTALAANCHIDATDGGIYRSTSSIRYKTDVVDYTKGLEELKTLRPVTYKGIDNGDLIFAGLIAEEVHDAGLSEFVMYNGENQPEALAYGNMIALAIKSIKELSDKVDVLNAKVEALEAQLAS